MRFIKQIIIHLGIYITVTATPVSGTSPIMYLPQGHVIDAISGLGYNKSTISTPATLGSTNPASIVDLSKLNLGFSYQYDTKLKPAWIVGIGHRRIFNSVPQSIGLSIPIKNLHLGLAMNQIYNSELDYGEIAGTFVWPNEQGYIETETFNPKRKESINRYSIIAAYDLNKYLSNSNCLSIGIQYNYNYLKYFQFLGPRTTELNDSLVVQNLNIREKITAGNVSIGIRYSTGNANIPRIDIGLYYETFIKFEKPYTFENSQVILIGNIPDKLHAGIYLKTPFKLYFSGNLSFIFWENIKNGSSITPNQLEVSGTIGYTFSKDLTLYIGSLFSDYRKVIEDDLFGTEGKFKVIYFIAGGTFQYKGLSFEFTCADSHLFSGDWRKQTLIKLGAGYSF
ncbi:MAG: hypothetical protein ISS81_08620 [Candidatus Marinimicrobia bacterium]|nr:hypothetical protein [Candidatus Neomarinimicrobiota bacterium]